MGPVVADTQAAVWYFQEPGRLSPAALAALDEASASGDPIYLSTISIIEVCYLVEKGKLLQTSLDRLYRLTDTVAGTFVSVPIDLDITRAVEQVPRDLVPEMPDRIIAATALHLGWPLVTSDTRIRATTNVTTIW
jgi:PIN domain nuclease of toxin-antitoxin system